MRSFGQNHEDVVLARALAHVSSGHYVEAGLDHPWIRSTSFSFYRAGWSGIVVEPLSEAADHLRQIRPRDLVTHAALSDESGAEVLLHVATPPSRSTLSPEIASDYEGTATQLTRTVTLNDLLAGVPWGRTETHFVTLDVEGSEAQALRGLDLTVYRPWVLVIESVHPTTGLDTSSGWIEFVTSAGYKQAHFDGVSRFFVAGEHPEVIERLRPASSRDAFIPDFPRGLVGADHSLRAVDTSMLASRELVQFLTVVTARVEMGELTGDGLVVELEKLPGAIEGAEHLARVVLAAAGRARAHEYLRDAARDLTAHAASSVAHSRQTRP